MRLPPYNTGKVKIGCRYDPPPFRYRPTVDEDRLQRALLGLGRPRVTPEYWAGLWALVAFIAFGLLMVAR